MNNQMLLDSLITTTQAPYLDKARAMPFLKWAGGKRSIIPNIVSVLPSTFGDYYEPFLGGGALFFTLEKKAQHSHLSDINAELMLTYRTIQEDLEPLLEVLKLHKKNHSSSYYKKIREQYANTDPIRVAARFIYLNKTCFNGLYRVNKAGKFNVPMGRYENPTICDESNLRSVNKVLQGVTLLYQSFKDVEVSKGSLIYCDPPYHGAFTDYIAGGFGDSEQKKLKDMADLWRESGAFVVLSNSDTPFVRKLYSGYCFHEVSAPRSINCKAAKRNNVTELLITSY